MHTYFYVCPYVCLCTENADLTRVKNCNKFILDLPLFVSSAKEKIVLSKRKYCLLELNKISLLQKQFMGACCLLILCPLVASSSQTTSEEPENSRQI